MAKLSQQNQQPLYMANNNEIFSNDIVSALHKAGVNIGDIVFVHSDISVFGKLMTDDRDLFFQSVIEAFQEAVGPDGTIIMPTFTYSVSEGKVFDVKNTKSTVGALTEYFRKLPGIKRTVEPMLSVAIWGKHQDNLLDIGHDSMGKNSIFDKLLQLNGKIVLFGTRECTFIHYIEQMHKAPYRFLKKFKGRIINGEENYEDEFNYYARYLDRNSTSYYSILEKYLFEEGLIKEHKLGLDKVLVIPSDLLFRETSRKLDQNINFLLKKEKDERK